MGGKKIIKKPKFLFATATPAALSLIKRGRKTLVVRCQQTLKHKTYAVRGLNSRPRSGHANSTNVEKRCSVTDGWAGSSRNDHTVLRRKHGQRVLPVVIAVNGPSGRWVCACVCVCVFFLAQWNTTSYTCGWYLRRVAVNERIPRPDRSRDGIERRTNISSNENDENDGNINATIRRRKSSGKYTG